MLLGAGLGRLGLGKQPSRNQLRIFLFVALGLLGIIFLWTTNGADVTPLTNAMSSWPAAVASSFSPGSGGDGSGVDGTSDSTGGSKYAEPIPPSTDISTDVSTDTTIPPLFVLVGDSTTRGQSEDGGGWGNAFIWLLARGAEGHNHGINGALSTGYYHSQEWRNVIDKITGNAPQRKVYVTIQFGHNDQMPGSNVTLELYQETLASMAREVIKAGGTPILVTPLARRDFSASADGATVVDNLAEYREATLRAHKEVVNEQRGSSNRARVINLNAASLAYIGAIGRKAAWRYNKFHPLWPDTTHLNEHGAIVFGRIVADLVLGHPPELVKSGERDPWSPGEGNDDDGLSGWIEPNPYLTGLVWHGDAA